MSTEHVFYEILMLGQPIIIGYVAAKQLNQANAGVFCGIFALILTWSTLGLFEYMWHKPLLFLAEGAIDVDQVKEPARVFMAAGLSSVIVLTISTILPKRQAS
jgi:hypothetical protein